MTRLLLSALGALALSSAAHGETYTVFIYETPADYALRAETARKAKPIGRPMGLIPKPSSKPAQCAAARL